MAGPTSHLILSYIPGSDRNDFTGEVGIRLGVGGGADIPINWIGARRHSSAQTGNHTVRVYEWFSDTIVATAIIDYTGVAVGSYAWTSVPLFTLLASGSYAVVMEITANDGQTWCNPGPTTYVASLAIVYGAYRFPASALSGTGTNEQFLGLDLGWSQPSAPSGCFSMMHFWQGGAGHIPYIPADTSGNVYLRRLSMPLGTGV